MADSKLKKIIDVLTLVIAVAALVYSIHEHSETVKLQEIQTDRSIKLENEKQKPVLQLIFRKSDFEPNKGIVIQNVGFGPAKITDFKYYFNEEDYQNNESYKSWLDDNGELVFTENKNYYEELNVLTEGYVLSPGRNEELYLLRDTASTFYDTNIQKDMDKLIIEIKYKSLSGFDTKEYFLRYCENFEENNIRIKSAKNTYE